MSKKNLNNRLVELEKSREEDYGSFNGNMNKIATAWSVLLQPYLKKQLPGWIIPLLYAQAKLIRSTHQFKEDTYDDALAYIVQAHNMHKNEEEKLSVEDLLNATE